VRDFASRDIAYAIGQMMATLPETEFRSSDFRVVPMLFQRLIGIL
jgi:hypothetical protein